MESKRSRERSSRWVAALDPWRCLLPPPRGGGKEGGRAGRRVKLQLGLRGAPSAGEGGLSCSSLAVVAVGLCAVWVWGEPESSACWLP